MPSTSQSFEKPNYLNQKLPAYVPTAIEKAAINREDQKPLRRVETTSNLLSSTLKKTGENIFGGPDINNVKSPPLNSRIRQGSVGSMQSIFQNEEQEDR